MRRRPALIALAIVVTILLLLLATIPLFVNADSLKATIIAQHEEQLNHKVSIQSTQITVFTGLGVQLNRAAIFDDPKFEAAPFVIFESLRVRPRLFPLLRKKVEIASIEMKQPIVHLIQNAAGVWNIESLAKRSAGTAGRAKKDSAAPGAELRISHFGFQDGTVEIRKFKLSSAMEKFRYHHIDFDLDDLSSMQPRSFQLKLQAPGAEKIFLRATGKFGPLNFQDLTPPQFEGTLSGSKIPMASFLALLGTETAAEPWIGNLTTSMRLQGSLDTRVSASGNIIYAGLGTRRGTRESAL